MPITRRRRPNPDQPENNNHLGDQNESAVDSSPNTEQPPEAPVDKENAGLPAIERTDNVPFSPAVPPPAPVSNGDRIERQDYTPSIEGGRRTARGELFRRPRTKSRCLWATYFTWHIIPAIQELMRRAVCCSINWPKKAKLVDVLVVGIVALSPSSMNVGTPVAKPLARLA